MKMPTIGTCGKSRVSKHDNMLITGPTQFPQTARPHPERMLPQRHNDP